MKAELNDIIAKYWQNKERYDFFDANCWLPFTQKDMFYPIMDIESLMSGMKKKYIKKAVVSSTECLDYDPVIGNDDLIARIKGHDHLYGGIVFAPETGFAKDGVRHYIDRMIENNVAVVRMFPKKLNHSMQKWQIGEALDYMEYKRLPLMLWHTEVGWDIIQGLCEAYPKLPIIVEGNDQKLLYHNRAYLPLLQRYNNLYIETHNLINHSGIEYMVNELNIKKLIFGTYFPYNDPDASMMMITDADIGDRVKHDIGHGNISALIDGIRR